ncbi:GSCOCG00001248001-RA-CDS [Cotesia congregata]|nr:GSCOCG00001248001-RA-CDS [Cotesia congregata]
MKGTKRDWFFRVQVPGLEKSDFVYVVGNLPELGAWNHNQAIQLHQENNPSPTNSTPFENSEDTFSNDGASDNLFCDSKQNDRVFSLKISLPTDTDIEFRYFIAVVCQSNSTKNSAKTLIIRKWETHMSPRLLKKSTPSNFTDDLIPDPEKFGYYNGYYKVERGWLTDETVMQFKLFNNPIKIWKNRLQNKKLYIKMTPVNLVRHSSLELQQFTGECVDDSLSMDTQDIVDQPAFSITEISVMNDDEATYKNQEQFGRAYEDDEFLTFSVAVRYPETIAYLVDYYVYGSRVFPGDSPPEHIGFSYILPSTLAGSVGILTIPITSTKHRPIGQLTVEYVIIKPIPDYPWDMSISYAKHWEERWSGLDVGHRGLGTSFKCEMKNCANVRENTIASLKTASHHGADMVEFDVQLSKDMIPVIYHDFHVSISMKRKKQIDAMDMLEIPVKDLTLEQLHLLKKLGLHAVIYDKIDEYNPKEVKESIFLVDARENQKDLLALACTQHGQSSGLTTVLDPENFKTPATSLVPPSNPPEFSFPAALPKNPETEDTEMGDLAKGFSECANSFGHSTKSFSPFIELSVDDAAKDCL